MLECKSDNQLSDHTDSVGSEADVESEGLSQECDQSHAKLKNRRRKRTNSTKSNPENICTHEELICTESDTNEGDKEQEAGSLGLVFSPKRKFSGKCDNRRYYSGCHATILDVSLRFKVHFLKTSKTTKFMDIKHLEVQELLDLLLVFAFGQGKSPTGAEVMRDVLSDNEEKPNWLRQLYEDPEIQLDLKTCPSKQLISLWERYENWEFSGKDEAREFLGHLIEVYEDILEIKPPLSGRDKPLKDRSFKHDEVKSLFPRMTVVLRTNKYRENGRCQMSLCCCDAPKEKTGDLRDHPVSVRLYKSKPDFVFGLPSSAYSIPVQVYSPKKLVMKAPTKKSRPSATSQQADSEKEKERPQQQHQSSSSENCVFSSDEHYMMPGEDTKLYQMVQNVKLECLPEIIDREGLNPNSAYHIAHKLSGQHIVELLSMASERVQGTRFKQVAEDETFNVCGLFVDSEYVYLSRLEVSKKYLSYIAHPLQNEWLTQSDYPKVAYGPTGFDITIHNHRMALLIFLKYYLDLNQEKKGKNVK